MEQHSLYELWFRLAYKPLILNQTLTAAVRPGNRRYPNTKGTKEGQQARVRIIVRPGLDSANIMPEFDRFETRVEVCKIIIKPIFELTLEDLAGCSRDASTIELLKLHLGLIYNKLFFEDDLVSVLRFKYVKY